MNMVGFECQLVSEQPVLITIGPFRNKCFVNNRCSEVTRKDDWTEYAVHDTLSSDKCASEYALLVTIILGNNATVIMNVCMCSLSGLM